jgi:hypothetical protein
MGKKQTKADKAFIKKIGTIGICTGAPKSKTCPDCGHEMQQVGLLAGEMNGHLIGGAVYAHTAPPRRKRKEGKVEPVHEQSFPA